MDLPSDWLRQELLKTVPLQLKKWEVLIDGLTVSMTKYIQSEGIVNVRKRRIEIRHRVEPEELAQRRLQLSAILQAASESCLRKKFDKVTESQRRNMEINPYADFYLFDACSSPFKKARKGSKGKDEQIIEWMNPIKSFDPDARVKRGDLSQIRGLKVLCANGAVKECEATWRCQIAGCGKYFKYSNITTHVGHHLFAGDLGQPFPSSFATGIGAICKCGHSGQMLLAKQFKAHSQQCDVRELIMPMNKKLFGPAIGFIDRKIYKVEKGAFENWLQQNYS